MDEKKWAPPTKAGPFPLMALNNLGEARRMRHLPATAGGGAFHLYGQAAGKDLAAGTDMTPGDQVTTFGRTRGVNNGAPGQPALRPTGATGAKTMNRE